MKFYSLVGGTTKEHTNRGGKKGGLKNLPRHSHIGSIQGQKKDLESQRGREKGGLKGKGYGPDPYLYRSGRGPTVSP